MGGEYGGWCILRTRGRHTLRLAQTLAEDGYEVWTPVETRTMRLPKMNARREIKLPIMPSYVFAKAHQLIDLIVLADKPVKPRRDWKNGYRRDKEHELPPHEDFDVLRCFGKIPMVSDRDLQALRVLEAKKTPRKRTTHTFAKGSPIKMEAGSFSGMSGYVIESDKGHTLVCFNETFQVKIPTCFLNEDGVYGEQPENGSARLAA